MVKADDKIQSKKSDQEEFTEFEMLVRRVNAIQQAVNYQAKMWKENGIPQNHIENLFVDN